MAKASKKSWAESINPDTNSLRVRLVVDFLEEGGGTLDEMLEFVNSGLISTNHKPIGKRLVQNALQTLKSGDFEHQLRDSVPLADLSELFLVKCRDGHYAFAKNSKRPVFNDFELHEKGTAGFLLGILDQHRYLPAVDKFINELKARYKIQYKSNDLREFKHLSGPVLQELVYTSQNMKSKSYIELLFTLQAFIRNRQVVEFQYNSVGNLSPDLSQKRSVKAMPLQLVLFDYFYYLIAAVYRGSQLVLAVYRVDQISKYQVEAYTDPDDELEQAVCFDYDELVEKFQLNTLLNDMLGMELPNDQYKLYKVQIKFTGWAASYAAKLQIHPSQKVLEVNVEDGTYTIELRLKLIPKANLPQPSSISLDFFMGRFREFAEVTKISLA